MIVSVAKLLAAGCAVTAPFLAGLLTTHVDQLGAAAVIALVGLGLGGFGLVVFCSLDSAEELDHLRRLNPNLRS